MLEQYLAQIEDQEHEVYREQARQQLLFQNNNQILTQEPLIQELRPSITTEKSQKCEICNLRDFLYKCPKCGVLYCSLECYKSQSVQKHASCLESFCKEQVEGELKSIKASQKQKNKINDVLYKKFKQGVDDDINETTEEGSSLISEKRLMEILHKIENGEDDFELNPNEVAEFKKFQMSQQSIEVWTPWWELRSDTPIHSGIQQVYQDDLININLNSCREENAIETSQANQKEQSQDTSQFETNTDKDFVDVDLDEDQSQSEEETCDFASTEILEILRAKLSKIPPFSSLTKKAPSPLLPYLIISNMCTFIFVSRRLNGSLSEHASTETTQFLLKQLLSTDSQNSLEQCFESAFFDHQRFLVVKAYQNENYTMPTGMVKQFTPIVLQDIQKIAKNVNLCLELWLRYYDLLSDTEQKTKSKTERRVIGLAKQKVIFYLAYLKHHGLPKGLDEEIKLVAGVYLQGIHAKAEKPVKKDQKVQEI